MKPELYRVIRANTIEELEDKVTDFILKKPKFDTTGGIWIKTDAYGTELYQAVSKPYVKNGKAQVHNRKQRIRNAKKKLDGEIEEIMKEKMNE